MQNIWRYPGYTTKQPTPCTACRLSLSLWALDSRCVANSSRISIQVPPQPETSCPQRTAHLWGRASVLVSTYYVGVFVTNQASQIRSCTYSSSDRNATSCRDVTLDSFPLPQHSLSESDTIGTFFGNPPIILC